MLVTRASTRQHKKILICPPPPQIGNLTSSAPPLSRQEVLWTVRNPLSPPSHPPPAPSPGPLPLQCIPHLQTTTPMSPMGMACATPSPHLKAPHAGGLSLSDRQCLVRPQSATACRMPHLASCNASTPQAARRTRLPSGLLFLLLLFLLLLPVPCPHLPYPCPRPPPCQSHPHNTVAQPGMRSGWAAADRVTTTLRDPFVALAHAPIGAHPSSAMLPTDRGPPASGRDPTLRFAGWWPSGDQESPREGGAGNRFPNITDQRDRNRDRAGQGRAAGLSLRGKKEFVTPTETNLHGDALCFIIKPRTIHKTTEASSNNGWRLAVGGWRLAVGGCWRLAVGGGWRSLGAKTSQGQPRRAGAGAGSLGICATW